MSYSFGQQAALALIPKFSASLGIASSLFTSREVIRDHACDEGNPIKRVLLFASLFEIMDSFGWWLSSWAVPSDKTDFAFASGTQGSCSLQGFLLQSAIGGPLNNAVLTYFFFVIVTQGHTATSYLEAIEWRVHATTSSFAVLSAILLLFLKQYNATNQVCWVNGSPPGCGSSVFGGGDVPCERGEHAYLYGLFFFYVIVWVVIISILVLNFRMRRFLLKFNSKDTSWLTTQAALFSLAFIITWLPSTLWSIMTWKAGGGFWLDLLAAICEPLQGFWNLLIFIRNRPESIERLERLLLCKWAYDDNSACDDKIDGDDEDASGVSDEISSPSFTDTNTTQQQEQYLSQNRHPQTSVSRSRGNIFVSSAGAPVISPTTSIEHCFNSSELEPHEELRSMPSAISRTTVMTPHVSSVKCSSRS